MKRTTACVLVGCVGLALLGASPAVAQLRDVDSQLLPALLEERGFVPPSRFKALVAPIERAEDGTLHVRWYDWRGTSSDRTNWWPASSVKLFAAIAALERVRELGFSPRARVDFADDGRMNRARVDRLVRDAIVPSNNFAFDRLVQIVGFDDINERFFSRRNGLASTVFIRSYGGRLNPTDPPATLRRMPAVTIRLGRREHAIPAREGRGSYDCRITEDAVPEPDDGNCTTLRDLAEAMRRVMLHEHLPARERFRLGERELEVLRAALESERPRGNELPAAIREGYGDAPIRIFHKPGFAYDWISDVMFVHRTDTDERWIVAAAAHGGRRVIDDALRHIGAVLRSGRLRARTAAQEGRAQ